MKVLNCFTYLTTVCDWQSGMKHICEFFWFCNLFQSDFEKGIEKVLGPLSLFSPTTQEDGKNIVDYLK